MTTRDTAVIGLGNMGRGIARNLDRAGRLGAAWDIAEAARSGAALSSNVARCRRASSAGSHSFCSSCPARRRSRRCCPDCWRARMTAKTLIDLTTSHPAKTKALAAKVNATGRRYVDCGMSGGAMGATRARWR